MKELIISGLMFCCFGLIVPVSADTLLLQQSANIFPVDHGEMGIDLNYSFDEWVQVVTNNDFTRRETTIALQARYSLKDNIELRVFMPYLSWKQTQTSSVDRTNDGLGVVAIGAKYNLSNDITQMFKTAVALDLDLPTGDPAKELGKGLNFELTGIGSMKVDPFDFHVNIGYKFTGAYINTNLVSVDIGDILKYGVAIEYPLSGSILVIAEGVGTSFSDYKVAGSAFAGTGGSTIDVLAGVRLNIDKMKIKLGVDFSLGDSAYRPYMWKIILGQSYLF